VIEHLHHHVGDTVCLALQRIVNHANFELRLYDSWQWQCGEGGSLFWAAWVTRWNLRYLAEIP